MPRIEPSHWISEVLFLALCFERLLMCFAGMAASAAIYQIHSLEVIIQ